MNLDSPRAGRRKQALRTQLREAVRATILDAAEELIAAKGLLGASLAMIAKRAGVAVGTLYNYFDDRDAMVRALFETRRAAVRPKLLAAFAAGADQPFEPRLRRFMRELLGVFDEYRLYIKVLFEAEHLKPPGSHHDLLSAIDGILAAGVAEGAITKASVEPLSVALAGALRTVLVRRSGSGEPFAAAADPIITVLLDGARKRSRP